MPRVLSVSVTHDRKVLLSAQILLQCQHTVGFCLQNHGLVTCLIALRKPAKARQKAEPNDESWSEEGEHDKF